MGRLAQRRKVPKQTPTLLTGCQGKQHRLYPVSGDGMWGKSHHSFTPSFNLPLCLVTTPSLFFLSSQAPRNRCLHLLSFSSSLLNLPWKLSCSNHFVAKLNVYVSVLNCLGLSALEDVLVAPSFSRLAPSFLEHCTLLVSSACSSSASFIGFSSFALPLPFLPFLKGQGSLGTVLSPLLSTRLPDTCLPFQRFYSLILGW